MRPALLLPIRRTLTALSAVTVIFLSGCGLGNLDTTSMPGDHVAFTGSVIGGENPVSNSTVTFYETKPTGVATNGVYVPAANLVPLGSTVSDANGNFRFATALACSSSSNYVYATAAGGNSGTNTSNQNLLLAAAVGSCNGFGSSTTTIINELTTVAAAYALQPFMTVSGTYVAAAADSAVSFSITGNEALVTVATAENWQIGQKVTLSGFAVGTYFNGNTYTIDTTPSTTTFSFPITHANVATTPDPTGVVTPNTVTPNVNVTSSATNYATASSTAGSLSAAGLAHAFANAANLVNVSIGQANVSLPSNAHAETPISELSALANSIQACVNTTGGVATSSSANDGTACGKLFSYTTVGTTVPTNTLQALLNIARYPTVNVANIYNLGSSFAAFVPNITTAPTDWSMSIVYTKFDAASNGDISDSNTTGLYYPYHLTLDYNDNVYVSNANASSTTQSSVLAFASNGTPIWQTAVDTTVNKSPRFIAADALGNVFVVNNGVTPYVFNSSGMVTTTGNAQIVEYLASTGAVEQTIPLPFAYPYGLAVDTTNNLWITNSTGTAGTPSLYEYTCSSPCGHTSTYTQYTFGTPATAATGTGIYAYQPVIDQAKNVWSNGYKSASAAVPFVLPYTAPQVGPPAVNAYNASEVLPSPAISGVTNYGLTVDSSGNGWITTTTTIVPLTATGAGYSLAIASGTAVPVTGASSLRFLNIDGNNTLWTADNSANAVVGYPTTAAAPAPFLLKGCSTNSSTPCAAGFAGPRVAQVDSTGSIWVISSTNGTVVQVIGTAAPTWPLLSDIKPGLMP